jgi:hypothetical protein
MNSLSIYDRFYIADDRARFSTRLSEREISSVHFSRKSSSALIIRGFFRASGTCIVNKQAAIIYVDAGRIRGHEMDLP